MKDFKALSGRLRNMGDGTRGAFAVACAFLGVLILSVAIFLTFGNSRVRRIFFFPRNALGAIGAEARFVTNYSDREGDIREFVEGELLGPVNHILRPLFPREASVRSIFVRNRVLYLDLSEDIAVFDGNLPLKGRDALDLLRKSISFNFPLIRESVILLGGQAPAYSRTEKNR